MSKKMMRIWGYLFVVALSLFGATGCANEGNDMPSAPVSHESSEQIIAELQEFNSTFVSELPDTRVRIGWVGWLTVAMSDASGAYRGAVEGAKVGTLIGPKGTAIGAAIGGAIVGTVSSYSQYETVKTIYKKSPAKRIGFQKAMPTVKELTACYVISYPRIPDNDLNYGIAWGIDPRFLRVGAQHNMCLNWVLEGNVTGMTISDGELDEVEQEVVENEDFLACFEEFSNGMIIDPENPTRSTRSESQTNGDRIMELFLNGVQNSVKTRGDLDRFITKYTAVVKKASQLTEVERNSLEVGFSVMGYSFDNWSDIWPYEESEDEVIDDEIGDDMVL